jgi:hypothetical protein
MGKPNCFSLKTIGLLCETEGEGVAGQTLCVIFHGGLSRRCLVRFHGAVRATSLALPHIAVARGPARHGLGAFFEISFELY